VRSITAQLVLEAIAGADVINALRYRDHDRCRYCGRDLSQAAGRDWHIDHVVPVCQGGRGGLDNLVMACWRCNLRKGGRTPEQAGMPLMESGRG